MLNDGSLCFVFAINAHDFSFFEDCVAVEDAEAVLALFCFHTEHFAEAVKVVFVVQDRVLAQPA